MLNITTNSIKDFLDPEQYKSFRIVERRGAGRALVRLIAAFFFLGVVLLFIPWTQNIRTNGSVTTLKPDQRPQTIHSVIAGRIEKWFVQEGDFVKKGDTILFISEIKDAYFDPNLLGRTQQQLTSKEMSVTSYMEKVKALDNQVDALVQTSKLKIQQAENKLKQAALKVQSDSNDFNAAKINFEIANEQLLRAEKLYEQGLKSLTDFENRRNKMQKANADLVSAKNKLLTSRNEIINAEVELLSIAAQYRDDIAKAESNKYTALSAMYDAEAVVTKLQNQFMNYSVRTGLYYITSPKDGYVTKAIQSGLGETIKEGEPIVRVMPSVYDLAIAIYVPPIDLPLLEKKQEVRIQFDGWPAIVFSGWPNTSVGTYSGYVYAIDNFISDNGKYRVLVSANPNEEAWPKDLGIGAGANGMILLQDVPIWYELWRLINGFPPDYYKSLSEAQSDKSKK